jgi:excisionase family DNA binding protein
MDTNDSPHFNSLPDWLTPQDARQYLRLSKSALYDKIRSGAIKSRKFGRLYRIPKEALRPMVR